MPRLENGALSRRSPGSEKSDPDGEERAGEFEDVEKKKRASSLMKRQHRGENIVATAERLHKRAQRTIVGGTS